jgi:putative membrane protein
MGFGFVVARFGLFLREIALAGHVAAHQHSTAWSLWIGVVLIALGVIVSVVASWEYFRYIRASRAGESYTPRTAYLAVVVALILALIGVSMTAYLILINP